MVTVKSVYLFAKQIVTKVGRKQCLLFLFFWVFTHIFWFSSSAHSDLPVPDSFHDCFLAGVNKIFVVSVETPYSELRRISLQGNAEFSAIDMAATTTAIIQRLGLQVDASILSQAPLQAVASLKEAESIADEDTLILQFVFSFYPSQIEDSDVSLGAVYAIAKRKALHTLFPMPLF